MRFLLIGLMAAASIVTTPLPEGRAFWSSFGERDKDKALPLIRQQLDDCATMKVTDLYLFGALKNQKEFGWDYLETICKEARARNIKIHPVYAPGTYSGFENLLMKHPEWMMRDREGRFLPNLNLAHPEARRYIIDEIAEAVKLPIDGIHLDFIRWQCDMGYSYDPATCAAFKKEYGDSPLEIKHQNCGSIIWCEWLRWNGNHIRTLVEEIRSIVKKAGKEYSAAVFPDHETAKLLIGQDWEQWVKDGLFDVICPMLYTPNSAVFKKYAERAVAISNGKCRVFPGIAVLTTHGTAPTPPETVAEQVRIAREVGADGVVFFAYYRMSAQVREQLGGVFSK